MNKKEFITELSLKNNITKEEAAIINNILEKHFIFKKKNQPIIINEISTALNTSEENASFILDTSLSILKTSLKEKIKHPFKSQN